MLNYILPFLIFISLGVIIYIVGKHLPEFRKLSQKKEVSREDLKDQKAIERFRSFLYQSGKNLKNGFFSLLEIIIKKIKQFLHLIHFWVLKVKKGNNGDDEISREKQVKKELIESEEENLEKIIEDDLSKDVEVDIKKDIFIDDEKAVIEEDVVVVEKEEPKKEVEIKEEVREDFFVGSPKNEKDILVIRTEEDGFEKVEPDETEDKIESFFSEEADQLESSEYLEEKKKFSPAAIFGIFGRFRDKFGKSKAETEEESEDVFNQEESFSDGIVQVADSGFGSDDVDENSLIKEVVPVAKKDSMDIDDEIGVDYSILEKKFIQKIANNPKDVENYRKLGELYIKMKSFSDAEECYRQVLKIHLRDVDAKRKLEKIKLLKRMG